MKKCILLLVVMLALVSCAAQPEPVPFGSTGVASPPPGCVEGRLNGVDC